jgi:TolB-like protein
MEWQNSIAILPCKNISSDPEQDIFCQGMTTQLISDLSRRKELKVIAEYSVMQYQGTSKTYSDIGKELNVAHLLSWNIRKSGDLMRITAQIIKTEDGSFTWAQDYDQEFKYEDSFNIQDAISERISSDLLTTLTSAESGTTRVKHTKNIDAWKSYMLGKHFNDLFLDRRNKQTFESARVHLERAITLDPDYALAYAELADLYNTYHAFTALMRLTQEEIDEVIRLQKQYIEKALELNSNLAEVQGAYGYVIRTIEKPSDDRENKIFQAFKKAYELNPNNAYANRQIGWFLRDKGLWRHAIPYFTRAVALNPLYPGYYFDRGWAYLVTGNLEKAELDFKTGLKMDPNYLRILYRYMMLLIQSKRFDEAESLSKRIDAIDPDRYRVRTIILAAARGEEESVMEHINSSSNNGRKMQLYAQLGMKEEALKIADRIREDLEKNYTTNQRSGYLVIKNNSTYDILRDDIRFEDMLAIMKRKYNELERKWGK